MSASPAGLAALREAVQPVYDELERNARTKEWIAEIAAMRSDGVATEPALSCAGGSAQARTEASQLEGRWRVSWTREELVGAGVFPEHAAQLRGTSVVEFANGRLRMSSGRATGSYTVDGDVVRLIFTTGVAVIPGRVYELRWSVYREKLTFDAVPGREGVAALLIEPLSRAR